MNSDELLYIKEIANKATRGPWRDDWGWVESDYAVSYHWAGTSNNICSLNDGEYIVNTNDDNDAKFIAESREYVPRLVDEINRGRNVIEEIRSFMETDATMQLSEEHRLQGIHNALSKYYE